jgi:hypothetical protein
MRKLSTWLTVGSLILACLVGIMTINVFQDKKSIEKDYQSLEKEYQTIKSKNDQLINKAKHVESLNNQINELKLKLANANGYSVPNSDSIEKLPFLKDKWDKVVIESGGEETEIDSPMILEQFKNSLHGSVFETNHPYPGGSRLGTPSFVFHIYSGDSIYSFQSLEDNFFKTIDDETFYKSWLDYKQIAKAFVKRPKYYPDTTMLSEYYHSGMMEGEKQYSTPLLSSFRIHSVVSSFMSADKEEVSNPTINEEYREKFTFYYFGKKLHMEIYNEYYHLYDREGSFDQWYKTDRDSTENTLLVLTAG